MKIAATQLRNDIYCACIFGTIALGASFGVTILPIVGVFFAFIVAVIIGFFTGWFDAPVWGRVVLGISALVGFIAALLIRGTQRFFLCTVVLIMSMLLGALIGVARGNAQDKTAGIPPRGG